MANEVLATIMEQHRDRFEAIFKERISAPPPKFEGTPEEQALLAKVYKAGLKKGYGEGLIDGVAVILQVVMDTPLSDLGGEFVDEPFAGLEGDDDLPF